MATLASVLALVAIAGAVASWIAGAMAYRDLRALGGESGNTVKRVLSWPMARPRGPDAPSDIAARMNKALVAFMTCVMVAMAAVSVATNLQRLAR